VGATDVLPFIPIEGVTIEDCVALARRVGEEIWKRFRIPVFFYEAAATRPDRVNLENVRRGQFRGTSRRVEEESRASAGRRRAKAASDGGRDGGGRTQVSHRLQRQSEYVDVSIANKNCEGDSLFVGRLRYVKSMGVDLKGRNLAQVSINLTDFEQTPMHRVYEMVKREAERYGVMPVGSEIVGLIPKKAIEIAADFFLQLENFSPARYSKTSWRPR